MLSATRGNRHYVQFRSLLHLLSTSCRCAECLEIENGTAEDGSNEQHIIYRFGVCLFDQLYTVGLTVNCEPSLTGTMEARVAVTGKTGLDNDGGGHSCEECNLFWRQFSALARKNLLLKRRAPLQLVRSDPNASAKSFCTIYAQFDCAQRPQQSADSNTAEWR